MTPSDLPGCRPDHHVVRLEDEDGPGGGDHLAVPQHRHDGGAGPGAGLGVAQLAADEGRTGRERDLLGEQTRRPAAADRPAGPASEAPRTSASASASSSVSGIEARQASGSSTS